MIKINVLIVENNPESKELIALGVKRYNSQNSTTQLNIVGEASSYEEAIVRIKSQIEPLHLIFLDIKLNTSKTGLDLCREFPEIAYIIVSSFREKLKDFMNETTARSFYYVEKVSEGVFKNSNDICIAVDKFINEKREDFFSKILVFRAHKILMGKIAIISKHNLSVHAELNEGKYYLKALPSLKKGGNDDHFFCYDRVVSTTDVEASQILATYPNINTSESILSLDHIVVKNNLDARAFVRISKSLIINLDFVEEFEPSRNRFTLKIRSFINSEGNVKDIYVYLKGSDSDIYLPDNIAESILYKINSRFHRP